MNSSKRSRRSAVLLFAKVHFLLGVVIVPGLMVVFPSMLPLLGVLIAGVVLTVVDTVGYGIGLGLSLRRCGIARRRLRTLTVLFSVGALALVPAFVVTMELIHLPYDLYRDITRSSPFWLPVSTMLAADVLGIVAGLTCRQPVSGHYCSRCEYDLRGQIEPRCPECGEAFDPSLVRSGAGDRDHTPA